MADPLFVYCFQELDGVKERPVLAQFIKDVGRERSTMRCVVKVGKREFTVHRGSCSETPFTQADMERYKPVAKEKKTKAAEPTKPVDTSARDKLIAKAGNLKSRFS